MNDDNQKRIWKCMICGAEWTTYCDESMARASCAPCGHQGLFKLKDDKQDQKHWNINPPAGAFPDDSSCPQCGYPRVMLPSHGDTAMECPMCGWFKTVEQSCTNPTTHAATLWDWEWRRILNLLTEELDVWEVDGPQWKEIKATIGAIENQTGIRKRQPKDKVYGREQSCGQFEKDGR